jgi:multicomponent Na+:H+ antiporter subunit B
MIFGLAKGETLVPVLVNRYLMCVGVLLYAGVGILSIFLDGMYLDYNVLSTNPSSGQHIGIILVELGVGITVATVMIALYHSFASFQESHE